LDDDDDAYVIWLVLDVGYLFVIVLKWLGIYDWL